MKDYIYIKFGTKDNYKKVLGVLIAYGFKIIDDRSIETYIQDTWFSWDCVVVNLKKKLITSGDHLAGHSFEWSSDIDKIKIINNLEDSFKREEKMLIATAPYSVIVSEDNVKIGDYNIRRVDIVSIFHKMNAFHIDS